MSQSNWQSSFVPDNSTAIPSAVQAQGWQSSFVPDNAAEKTSSSIPDQMIAWGNSPTKFVPDNFPKDKDMNLSQAITGTQLQLGEMGVNAVKSGVSGLGELLARAGGENPPSTDMSEGGPLSPLSPNAMMTLPMIGPAAEGALKGASKVGDLLSNMGENDYNHIPPVSPTSSATDNLVSPTSSDIKLIKQKLDLAGITPQQYADALLKSNPDDFAGELGGDPLRMQTQAQAKVTGPSMQAARDAMRDRLATAPQRVQQIIEQTFFPSSGVEPTVGGDATVMKGAASPIQPIQQAQGNLGEIQGKLGGLYDAANNATVPRKPFLDIINTPNGQSAMKSTVQRLANQNITPEQAGMVVDPNNGFIGLRTNDVPISTMQEVQKSLGGMIKRNPLTGEIEDPDSLLLEQQRQHITSTLAENSPEFAKANMNAAANFQGENAFSAGRKLAHAAAGENADALAQRATDTFSPQELSYQKSGYAQGLADMLEGSPLGGGNPAARIAKGTVQNTASDILQSPTKAQQFADALMQEKNRVQLAQNGLGGSQTADTLTAGVPQIPTSLHGIAGGIANKVMDFVNAGKNERIAQLLYATSPEQKAVLANKILQ